MRCTVLLQVCVLLWTIFPLYGQEVHDLYRTGKYEEYLKALEKSGGKTLDHIKALKVLGRYDEALKVWIDAGIRSSEITSLYEGIELFRLNGREKDAEHLITRLTFFVNNGYFSDANELVTRGRTALLKKVDAAVVLKDYFDEAIRRKPDYKEAYLAAAELAFSKDDSATAATILQKANKQFGKDPDILFGLSRAFGEADGKLAEAALKEALSINPNHLPTLKHLLKKAMLGDDLIKSKEFLDKITAVNKSEPEILALQACFSLLKNEPGKAGELRSQALSKYKKNPEVDFIIGNFLAYRGKFKASNKYLEKSWMIDPDHLPSLVSFSLNLLRLGDTEKGFKIAADIAAKDPYNLTAFNLLQLQDVFKKMHVVENEFFKIRLNEHDAKLYGEYTLNYLMEARKYYNEKYGYQSKEKVFVDFYNDAEDFAIRNFSYPLEFGALGICFGQVITMKTIEAQSGSVNNWRETLWHEYGHVVTLGMTDKNIPRWLTEGISVYEETLGKEGWGMKLTPEFRERIVKGDLYPLEHLNAGFHSQDIMFAYYQAGLEVKYLIEKKGFDNFKKMLFAMAGEAEPLAVLEKFYGKLDDLNKGFPAFAVKIQDQKSSKADFSEVEDVNLEDMESVKNHLKQNPHHYPSLMAYAQLSLKSDNKKEAIETLKNMIDLYPEFLEPGNAYEKLAEIYRHEENETAEQDLLLKYVKVNANSEISFERLAAMSQKAGNWNNSFEYAERLMGVNPLSAFAYRTMGIARMKSGDSAKAEKYFEKVLLCKDSSYNSEVHYHMAAILKNRDKKSAKRHILMCLEQAPRYRDAYKLLLELE